MRAVREEGDKTRALNKEMFRDFMEAPLREGRQTRSMIGDMAGRSKSATRAWMNG